MSHPISDLQITAIVQAARRLPPEEQGFAIAEAAIAAVHAGEATAGDHSLAVPIDAASVLMPVTRAEAELVLAFRQRGKNRGATGRVPPEALEL